MADQEAPREWAPIKVEKQLARTLKTIASWKNLVLRDYVDKLLREGMEEDYKKMAVELQDLLTKWEQGRGDRRNSSSEK